ncbi:hypothetical protein ANO11243_001470 [Dothideomycetidae sp. 11243]|nr:hypothetical protein ANO11243_001470 [fungal sp. No.11243]
MTAWFKKPATKSAIKDTRAGSRDQSPSKSVMFSSPARDMSSMDTDRQSQETASTRGRRSKRSSKPRSSYSICYAPPRSSNRHKIQVRTRPLLQLHKLESGSRPRPEFELLPSAIFSSRLNKAIARFSPSKHGIAPTDLAIVRAEKYHEHEASQAEEDESRDILALIGGLAKGSHGDNKARIYLEHGVEWEAYRLSNGGYECVTIDAHGLKKMVRWVQKKNNRNSDSQDEPLVKKFKFSTISQNTRRHPVIAHLTGAGLDISDVYSMPASSRAASPQTTPMERQDSQQSLASGEQMLTTTDELRSIITATAVFVALCEGWCPGYRSEDILSRSPSQRSVTSTAGPHKRNMSFDTESLRRNGSMRQALRSPSFFRSSSFKHDSRPSSSSSSVVLDNMPIHPIPEAEPSKATSEQITPRRARADTVSTVIVSDSPSQWHPTIDDETEDEAEEDVQEEEMKSQMGSEMGDKRRHSGMTLLDGSVDNELRSRAPTLASSTTKHEKRTVSSSTAQSEASINSIRREKEKKFSNASTVVGSDETKRKKPKRRNMFVRILLCGLL